MGARGVTRIPGPGYLLTPGNVRPGRHTYLRQVREPDGQLLAHEVYGLTPSPSGGVYDHPVKGRADRGTQGVATSMPMWPNFPYPMGFISNPVVGSL